MTNYAYLKTIVEHINQLNIKDSSYKDEIVDHYATRYEELIVSHSPQEALEEVISSIKNDNFQQKNKNMKSTYIYAALATALIALLSVTIFANQNKYDSTIFKEQLAQIKSPLNIDPPYGNPLKDIDVVSGYGERRHPIAKVMKLHTGIDLKAPLGTPVYCVEKGSVVDCGYDEKYGYFIEIQHDETYSTRFHHLQKINVKIGQAIDKNHEIGAVGTSGMSTGPHLHYEIIERGKKVDPKKFLRV